MLPEIALTSQFMDRFASALRLPARRVAFGALRAGARAGLAGHRQRRGTRRRRRTLGAVPALQRPRPHRRRRGARRRLQAGRPRELPGPRHGDRARQRRQVPGHPLIRDAVDREPCQRPHRALSQRRAAEPLFRRRAARGHAHRHAQGPARARPLAFTAARLGHRRRRSPISTRRCCSSIAAAMRR